MFELQLCRETLLFFWQCMQNNVYKTVYVKQCIQNDTYKTVYAKQCSAETISIYKQFFAMKFL